MPKTGHLAVEDVRTMLRQRARPFITQPGGTGLNGWCRANDVPNTHAIQFLNGTKKGPPRAVLRALGLRAAFVAINGERA